MNQVLLYINCINGRSITAWLHQITMAYNKEGGTQVLVPFGSFDVSSEVGIALTEIMKSQSTGILRVGMSPEEACTYCGASSKAQHQQSCPARIQMR